MFKKNLLLIAFAIVVAAAGSMEVYAQPQFIRGVVKIQKAGGSEEVVADAVVEAYRTDTSSGRLPETKTNSRGEFSFTAPNPSHVYALTASAEGAAARVFPNAKAGMEGIVIVLAEGDGDKVTEEEVRELVAAIGADGTLDAEKLKQSEAERQKQLEAFNAEKDRVENATKIVNAALKDGNAAFEKKQYDVAIAKYTEGYEAQPDFAGSAVVMLNNRGVAQRTRAVDHYMESAKLTDINEKAKGFQEVKKYLSDSLESHVTAWRMLKNADLKVVTKELIDENKPRALNGSVETIGRMAETRQADESRADMAKEIVEDFLKEEKNKDRIERARLNLAEYFLTIGDSGNATTEYRKLLETSPNHLEGMVGLASSLINQGYIVEAEGKAAESRTFYQEAANMLQEFLNKAPGNHNLKPGVEGQLGVLKDMKITPQRSR